MKIISHKRCIIGEGPIWNDFEHRLYYTNGMGGNEICMLDVYSGNLMVRKVELGIAAFAFTKDNKMIVSRRDGVYVLNDDDTIGVLYNTADVNIICANDMKVGPDGRIYVGTQSGKRAGISNEVDGKLYSIDMEGNVRVILDNISLSNGLDWSIDEKYFYHTDSDTKNIKEYNFCKNSGEIEYTGRYVEVEGVDGFTVDEKNNIIAACWGMGHLAVVDTEKMEVKDYIKTSAKIPTSCCFCGDNSEILAVTSASWGCDFSVDDTAGYTQLLNYNTKGRKAYLFGL